jgi:hypothetical protein
MKSAGTVLLTLVCWASADAPTCKNLHSADTAAAAAAAAGAACCWFIQVMEEIIAKSKAAKAEKARQKEADEAALDALDSSFKAISGGLAAFVKPTGFDK